MRLKSNGPPYPVGNVQYFELVDRAVSERVELERRFEFLIGDSDPQGARVNFNLNLNLGEGPAQHKFAVAVASDGIVFMDQPLVYKAISKLA